MSGCKRSGTDGGVVLLHLGLRRVRKREREKEEARGGPIKLNPVINILQYVSQASLICITVIMSIRLHELPRLSRALFRSSVIWVLYVYDGFECVSR